MHFANTRMIALIVLLGITACVHYTRPGDPEKVVYALYEDIKDWDPATAFSLEVMVLGNIYEPLHWYVADSTGGYHFRPALATRYEHSNDGLHWTFYLR
ncbi:MAG TPA: ABC transporter substrate-binding protein, partial [Calditrichae bacterium]|nr:ABC transporter substrate-binding protein [Calditrichia bacterium]